MGVISSEKNGKTHNFERECVVVYIKVRNR